MHILYADNFRGFESTFLTLRTVNFFVGENSTGKTSILKLISIISSPGFWLYGTFGVEESGLGTFADILTKPSSQEYFEIGILSADDANASNVLAITMRFVDNNGTPSLKELRYFNGHYNIQVSLEGHVIKYRYNTPNYEVKVEEYDLFFRRWIEDNDLGSQALKRELFESNGISAVLFYILKLISLNETDDRVSKGKGIRFDIEPPIFLKNLVWIGADRSGPKANYSLNDEAALALKQLLEAESPLVVSILRAFGLDSGLFEEIVIKELGKKRDKDSPFEIRLKSQNKELNISNVGYGISQVIPLIALPLRESKINRRKSWIAIQAPEIHLHPLAQAAYGDFIYKCCEVDKQRFIIETHSDHTIDRFRMRVKRAQKDGNIKTENLAQVAFFRKEKKKNVIEMIAIQSDGSYPLEQPREFRQFFIDEQLKLLNI